jgi:hypothetical protein
MVLEHEAEHPIALGDILSIAGKIGCRPDLARVDEEGRDGSIANRFYQATFSVAKASAIRGEDDGREYMKSK